MSVQMWKSKKVEVGEDKSEDKHKKCQFWTTTQPALEVMWKQKQEIDTLVIINGKERIHVEMNVC